MMDNQHNEQDLPVEAAGEVTAASSPDLLRAFIASLSEADRKTLSAVLERLAAADRRRAEEEARAAQDAAMAEMDKLPAFAGILDRRDALSALIEQIDWLRALPMHERLSVALYLDRGMQKREPSPAEKLESVLSDPALMQALAERAALSREKEAALCPPTLRSARGGRMPASVKKQPKSLDEAGEAAKHYFKIRK